jgi:hypothetical protein
VKKLPKNLVQHTEPYKSDYVSWVRDSERIFVDMPRDVLEAFPKVGDALRTTIPAVSNCLFKTIQKDVADHDSSMYTISAVVIEWQKHLSSTEEVMVSTKRKCNCEMLTLMRTGCLCGGV